MSTVLHLTLKKKWFDMIASGEKKEEYREVKKYWIERLTWHEYHTYGEINLIHALASKEAFRRDFDYIEFKNGYGRNVPTMLVAFKGIHYGVPKKLKWADDIKEHNWYFCIELGEIISIKNNP